jgi:hypothetical protein
MQVSPGSPQNWWVRSDDLAPVGGAAAHGGGGSIGLPGYDTGGSVYYRNILDANRSAQGPTPAGAYPDGYLGNIIDRHQDKLLEKVKDRLTDRSYQRGTHVGSKISPKDYYWEQDDPVVRELDPMAGIRRQANFVTRDNLKVTKRFNPTGNPVERLAHLGKTAGMSTPEQLATAKKYGVNVSVNPVTVSDPRVRERAKTLLPRYGWR